MTCAVRSGLGAVVGDDGSGEGQGGSTRSLECCVEIHCVGVAALKINSKLRGKITALSLLVKNW